MATLKPVDSSNKLALPTSQVNFVCQKCFLPLRLDPSFHSLDPQTLRDLSAPLATTTSGDKEHWDTCTTEDEEEYNANLEDGVSRKHIQPSRLSTNDSGGFTVLGESDISNMENLSHRVKVTSHLFDIMSGESDIDHPLCEECTDTLLDQLDEKLKITEDECKDYRDLLERLNQSQDHDNLESLQEEIEELKKEQLKLTEQLEEVEEERKQIADDMQREKGEVARLQQEEERYWKEYSEYKRQYLDFMDEQRSVDSRLKYAQVQLDKLRKTNVFNATFHIWHSGHFGTINNFRLGRLPSVPVEWTEINAAWGQTVLLLHSLAQKMNLKFKRYQLVPYGNHSFLESLTDKSKELPLYGSGGFRFFWDTKYDQAMVAFLDCLQQFKEEVERGDTGFCLPYKMSQGRIEDSASGTSYSIKIQFNSEEQWTKALKFMLTNLKWGLAWVSSQFTK
ncbi:beclin-1-like [Ptychodera flava]|uniref:beclin-1-like n=1 Tax=Ptychodera flava TaxID=63121 RepID=UPI00396A4DB1